MDSATVSIVNDYTHCYHSFRRNSFIQHNITEGLLVGSAQVTRMINTGRLLAHTELALLRIQLRGILMALPSFSQQLLVLKTMMALGDTNDLHHIIRRNI